MVGVQTTEKNLEKAFYWYQKAAENGYNDAQCNIAYLHYIGEETEKNLEKAFYWYQKAAEYGNDVAINNLAACYENGEGTEKNLEKAFYLFQKAQNSKINSNLKITNYVKNVIYHIL